MDPDDLALIYSKLTVSEIPIPSFDLKEVIKMIGLEKMRLCLMAKIMSVKTANTEGFRRNMITIWRVSKEFVSEVFNHNLFIIQFGCIEDKRKIQNGGPSHHDNALIILQEPTGIGTINSMDFKYVDFWVQFHNIPVACMNKETTLFLGEKLGMVRDIDVGVAHDCLGSSLRIRIQIDITKPLEGCFNINFDDGISEKILIRYEKLPDYCWDCGLIGHTHKECNIYAKENNFSLNHSTKYVDWLKASTGRKFSNLQHFKNPLKDNKATKHTQKGKTNQTEKNTDTEYNAIDMQEEDILVPTIPSIPANIPYITNISGKSYLPDKADTSLDKSTSCTTKETVTRKDNIVKDCSHPSQSKPEELIPIS